MFSKVVRIGRINEMRYLTDGQAILNIAVAYNYGRKGQDGKKPSQWIDIGIFGKQAEGLAPHLHVGDQIFVSVDDLHIEEYEGKNGKGVKLTGILKGFDFVTSATKGATPEQKPAEQPKPKPIKTGGFDGMDFDDAPF